MELPKNVNSNKPNKHIIAWIFFAILVLFAIVSFFISFISYLIFFCAAFITCPIVWDLIQKKFKIGNAIRVPVAIILFFIAIFMIPTNNTEKEHVAALSEQESSDQKHIEREKAEKEESERIAQEQAEKEESERIAQEQAEKEESERIAQEQAEKEESERIAREQAEIEESERIAREQAEKEESERIAQEQATKEEQNAITQNGQETTTPEQTATQDTQQQQSTVTYVLNTNTKRFHYPHCSSVSKITQKNYATSNSSRDDIIAQGYVPCKNCNP